MGIIICGKLQWCGNDCQQTRKIRAALCWLQISKLSDNNTQIYQHTRRFVSLEQAVEMVDLFISIFEGGRHQKELKNTLFINNGMVI